MIKSTTFYFDWLLKMSISGSSSGAGAGAGAGSAHEVVVLPRRVRGGEAQDSQYPRAALLIQSIQHHISQRQTNWQPVKDEFPYWKDSDFIENELMPYLRQSIRIFQAKALLETDLGVLKDSLQRIQHDIALMNVIVSFFLDKSTHKFYYYEMLLHLMYEMHNWMLQFEDIIEHYDARNHPGIIKQNYIYISYQTCFQSHWKDYKKMLEDKAFQEHQPLMAKITCAKTAILMLLTTNYAYWKYFWLVFKQQRDDLAEVTRETLDAIRSNDALFQFAKKKESLPKHQYLKFFDDIDPKVAFTIDGATLKLVQDQNQVWVDCFSTINLCLDEYTLETMNLINVLACKTSREIPAERWTQLSQAVKLLANDPQQQVLHNAPSSAADATTDSTNPTGMVAVSSNESEIYPLLSRMPLIQLEQLLIICDDFMQNSEQLCDQDILDLLKAIHAYKEQYLTHNVVILGMVSEKLDFFSNTFVYHKWLKPFDIPREENISLSFEAFRTIKSNLYRISMLSKQKNWADTFSLDEALKVLNGLLMDPLQFSSDELLMGSLLIPKLIEKYCQAKCPAIIGLEALLQEQRRNLLNLSLAKRQATEVPANVDRAHYMVDFELTLTSLGDYPAFEEETYTFAVAAVNQLRLANPELRQLCLNDILKKISKHEHNQSILSIFLDVFLRYYTWNDEETGPLRACEEHMTKLLETLQVLDELDKLPITTTLGLNILAPKYEMEAVKLVSALDMWRIMKQSSDPLPPVLINHIERLQPQLFKLAQNYFMLLACNTRYKDADDRIKERLYFTLTHLMKCFSIMDESCGPDESKEKLVALESMICIAETVKFFQLQLSKFFGSDHSLDHISNRIAELTRQKVAIIAKIGEAPEVPNHVTELQQQLLVLTCVLGIPTSFKALKEGASAMHWSSADTHEGELDELRLRAQQLQGLLDASKALNQARDAEVPKLRAELAACQAQLSHLEAKLSAASQRCERQATELSRKEALVESLKGQMVELNDRVHDLQSQIESHERQAASVRAQIAKLTSETESLRATIAHQEQNLVRQRQRLEQAEQANLEIIQLEAQLQRLQLENADLTSQKKDNDADREDQADEIDVLTERMATLTLKHDRTVASLTECLEGMSIEADRQRHSDRLTLKAVEAQRDKFYAKWQGLKRMLTEPEVVTEPRLADLPTTCSKPLEVLGVLNHQESACATGKVIKLSDHLAPERLTKLKALFNTINDIQVPQGAAAADMPAVRHKAYITGGLIRDALTGQDCSKSDIDIVTTLEPEYVRYVGREQLIGGLYFCPNESNPNLFTNEEWQIDLVCHPELNLKAHASRSDLAINSMALYYEAESDDFRLLDPLGIGLEQVEAGSLDVLGLIQERFSQDPIRGLRLLRFSLKLDRPLTEEQNTLIPHYCSQMHKVPYGVFANHFSKLLQHPKAFQKLDEMGCYSRLFGFDISSAKAYLLEGCKLPQRNYVALFLSVDFYDKAGYMSAEDYIRDYLSKWSSTNSITDRTVAKLSKDLEYYHGLFSKFKQLESAGTATPAVGSAAEMVQPFIPSYHHEVAARGAGAGAADIIFAGPRGQAAGRRLA